MITVSVDDKSRQVTYTTIISVDGRYVSLSITKHVGYAKLYQLDQTLPTPKGYDRFEDTFYWTEDQYTDPSKHHLAYTGMRDSGFNYRSGLRYEVQWEHIDVIRVLDARGNLRAIELKGTDRSHPIAVPYESTDDRRIDYITPDGRYRFGCTDGEHQGIRIVIDRYK